MFTVDYQKLAEKFTRDSFSIKEGQLVLLSGGINAWELLEEIKLALLKIGAYADLSVGSENLKKRIYEEVPDQYIGKTPDYLLKRLEQENIIGEIAIEETIDPKIMSNITEEKLAAVKKSHLPVEELYLKKRIHRLVVSYPTVEKALFYQVEPEEFFKLVWEGMLVDNSILNKTGSAIRDVLLKGGGKIYLTSDKGSDLYFELRPEKRPVYIDDGIVYNEKLGKDDIMGNLPAGEVCTAPVEGSVCGKVVFDLAFHRGYKIENLVLNFDNGRLTSFSAEKNEHLFAEVLANASGEKDRLGELGIGTNPKITKATGYINTDEKIAGTVHLALGNNKMMQGDNKSSLHWDLIILKPTLYSGGFPIIRDGNLLH